MPCEDVEPDQPQYSPRPKPPASACVIETPIECLDCGAERVPLPERGVGVGYTMWGIQIWCHVHNKNVLHIDFLDQQLPIATGG